MDANELTARLLFDGQMLLMPSAETGAYRLAVELKQSDARLIVLSLLEDDSHQAVHDAVFARMLPRVPEQNAKVIYTQLKAIDPTVIQSLTNATYVLLCGVSLARTDVELHQGIKLGHVNVLLTDNIEKVDADPALKKNMWTAWMKQFAA